MIGWLEDLRHGLTVLGRNRGFAAVAVLSLALGIGANTTIFSFLNAIFLQQMPVAQPASLVSVATVDAKVPGYLGCSYPNYKDYRDRNRSFADLLIYSEVVGTLTGRGDPQPLVFEIVSGNYFEGLGVNPVVGRSFLPEEDTMPDANPVAVISYGLWRRRFGGNPGVAGQYLEINGHRFQIVGVAPAGFQGLNQLIASDVWVPMMMYRELYPNATWVTQRRGLFFSVAGRLRPGVTAARAEAEMQSLAAALQRQYPRENQGRGVTLIPLPQAGINYKTRALLTNSGTVLMIVAGLVLLIACANVANLLLARAAGRNREIAVRVALGASRWRLIRQLLTESTSLALAGGAVGLLLARWADSLLWALRPPLLSSAAFRIGVDARVLAFTVLLCLLTGILFGLAPALRTTNPDLATDLKERTSAAASGFGARQPRSVLVACQVALCVVALVGAGLFIRSLQNADRLDPGFNADHLGMVSFNLSDRGYGESRGRQFLRAVLGRVSSLPGVESAALARDKVFRVTFSRTVLLNGDSSPSQGRFALVSPISPNYLRTMGIPLLRGRDFSEADTEDTPHVAIVNQAAAARFWPNQNPIGRRLQLFGDNQPLQIIGVARDANYLALGEPPQALFYTAMAQDYAGAAVVIFRTSADPDAVGTSVQRAMQSLEPGLLLQTASARSVIRGSLWAPRLSAALLTVFGLLALVLASLGVYGIVSYSVNQRIREIGVRMALGATTADVQMLVLRQGMAVVTVGVIGGLLIALGASRAVQSLLFVTSARDSLTFVLVPSILVLVAILACWGPALRATRIDPATALRDQ